MQPSQQNHNRNLIAVLFVSLAARFLVDVRADDGYQWQAHDVAMHISVVSLVGLVAWLLPFRMLAAKCVVFAWLGFELLPLVESVFRLVDIESPPYTISFQCAVSASMAGWYFLRSYKASGDALDEKNLFICRLKPRSAQDVLLAMAGEGGLGSVAIYYQKQFWHYSHGVLVKDFGFKRRSRYVAVSSGVPDAMTIRILDGMVGSKWSVFKNCITMLYATAKTGAPLFKHWR